MKSELIFNVGFFTKAKWHGHFFNILLNGFPS